MARIKGSTDTAIPLYQQEIQKNPEYLPALEALAAAYKEKKDWKSARDLRQKISELKSNPHGEAQEK
jgi:tetratricopeptide (TPR) repeat protein